MPNDSAPMPPPPLSPVSHSTLTVVSSSPPPSHKKLIIGIISLIILMFGLGAGIYTLVYRKQTTKIEAITGGQCPNRPPGVVITGCSQICCTNNGCVKVNCSDGSQDDWNGGPGSCSGAVAANQSSCPTTNPPSPTTSTCNYFDSNVCQICICNHTFTGQCTENCHTGSCSETVTCGQKDYPSPNRCDPNGGCPGSQCGAVNYETFHSSCVNPTTPPGTTATPGITASVTPVPLPSEEPTPSITPVPLPSESPSTTPGTTSSPSTTPSTTPTTPSSTPSSTSTPSPTSPRVLTNVPCNGSCSQDSQCESGFVCYLASGSCRKANNITDPTCGNVGSTASSGQSAPTPTPVTQLPRSGATDGTWIVGLGGLLLLGLGALFLI